MDPIPAPSVISPPGSSPSSSFPQTVPPQQKKDNTLLWILLAILLFGTGFSVAKVLPDNRASLLPSQTTPTPTQLTQPTPTLDITDGWSEYLNEEVGVRLKHPAMDMTCCAIDVGRNKLLATFAVKSTVAPSTDKPFDGFVIAVAELGNQTWNQFISAQKNILTGNYQVYGTTPTATQDVPVTVNGQQGLWLKGYSIFNIEYLYIPFPVGKRVLVVGKNNESPGSFDKTFDQILSTFKFVNPLSVVTPPSRPLPTRISGILSTSDWKLVSNSGVAFKIPNYASCDSDTQCSNITYTSYYQGTPSPLPAKISVYVTDYRGGSRRQQYLDGNKSITDCKPLFVESLFGSVDALQIPIDGGWCQGGYIGGIVSVVGSKLVVIGPGLTYNNNKEISRWDVRDTLVSSLRVQ